MKEGRWAQRRSARRRLHVRLDHDVFRDEDVHRVARPDRDGRLNGEVLLGDLRGGLVDGAAGVGCPELRDRRGVAGDVSGCAVAVAERSVPSATPVTIRHQWWLTSSENPDEPARSTPGMHSREIETPSGRISRFQQTNTRSWPKLTAES